LPPSPEPGPTVLGFSIVVDDIAGAATRGALPAPRAQERQVRG
jgi:hypothetical protein